MGYLRSNNLVNDSYSNRIKKMKSLGERIGDFFVRHLVDMFFLLCILIVVYMGLDVLADAHIIAENPLARFDCGLLCLLRR